MRIIVGDAATVLHHRQLAYPDLAKPKIKAETASGHNDLRFGGLRGMRE